MILFVMTFIAVLNFASLSFAFRFTGMSEECEDGFAFSPGVGAAVNCFFPLINIQGADGETLLDGAGLHRSKDPGAGAFTPYHGRYSYAMRDIQAGEELFTYYGEAYFTENQETFGLIPIYSSYDEADKFLKQYVQVRDEVCPYGQSHCDLHEDWYSLIQDLRSVWPSRTLNALPEDSSVIDHIANVGTSWTHYNRSIRSIQWLQDHGHCADHLEPGGSTIPQAGRGAFARRFLGQGEVISPLPVIQVNRSLMDMYPTYYDQEGMIGDRNATVRHQQLLLNYCFGHDHSEVLLCPYGMVSSLINHSRKKANAKLEWNYKLMKNPEWLEHRAEQWLSSYHAGLMLNVVATRNILPGEEVFMDYGDSWDDAWNNFVANWAPPKGSDKYYASYDLNGNTDVIIRTVAEGGYSSSQVEVSCLDIYRVWSGLEPTHIESHTCRAIDRFERNGEQRYTVELYYTFDEEEGCSEQVFEVLLDVPRDVFWFTDAPYSRDAAQPWSFRHPIGIPDDIMPEAWIQ
jgi:SET domain